MLYASVPMLEFLKRKRSWLTPAAANASARLWSRIGLAANDLSIDQQLTKKLSRMHCSVTGDWKQSAAINKTAARDPVAVTTRALANRYLRGCEASFEKVSAFRVRKI
jgi:6-phosphogluconate dehydrogenase (decarboxylating)